MSIAALKNYIVATGGTTHGLLEKHELVARAKEQAHSTKATTIGDVDYRDIDPSSVVIPQARPAPTIDIEHLSINNARYSAERFDDSLALRVFMEPLMRHCGY